MTTNPTVVLVHGAFADSASFAAVVPDLLADGLRGRGRGDVLLE